MTSRPERYDAVLLAGGGARRMGGVDKPGLRVGDRPLAARVAAAVACAQRVIVVGPAYPEVRADVVTREDPPGGGPVAAIAAGVAHVGAPVVAVLAADLPFLTGEVVALLRAAVAGHDLALLVDGSGHDQFLVGAWRVATLRAALAATGDPLGVPVRRLVAAVGERGSVVRRTVPVAPGDVPPWFDCDTEADLRRARQAVDRHGAAARKGGRA